MRCKCCDEDNASWWVDGYYCNYCKKTIIITAYDLEEDEEVDEATIDTSEVPKVRS